MKRQVNYKKDIVEEKRAEEAALGGGGAMAGGGAMPPPCGHPDACKGFKEVHTSITQIFDKIRSKYSKCKSGMVLLNGLCVGEKYAKHIRRRRRKQQIETQINNLEEYVLLEKMEKKRLLLEKMEKKRDS